MAAAILMVPIRLDALYLKKDRSVVETMADFSRLPYVDGKRDVNPDVANLSEEILSQPFEDRGLQLKAGVHLHWALPAALTRGFQQRGSSLFSVGDFIDLPAFVAKLRTQDPISKCLWNQFSASTQGVLTSATSTPEEQKLALVQALDNILKGVLIYETVRFAGVALSPETLALRSQNPRGKDLIRLNRLLLEDAYPLEIAKSQQRSPAGEKNANSIVFPFVPNRWLVTRMEAGRSRQWVVESDYLYPPGQGGPQSGISYPYAGKLHPQPYRYLGRKLPLAAWSDKDAAAEYLEELTAVGYGEPTFAAFYPNCLGIFGFHDEAPPPRLKDVEYDVIGWYSNPQQDCLYAKSLSGASAEARYEALKEVHQWVVEHAQDRTGPPFPQKTICFAHLTFATDAPVDDLPEERKVAVALGNTGAEALSAYLADLCVRKPTIAGPIPKQEDLEDQLESVHLGGQLEGKEVDLGPKFREARHNAGFTGVTGGTLWTIRPESAASGQANAPEAAALAQDTLPSSLASALHCLNVQQQAYDRDCDEVESLRKQLFADWYKYMLCVYPPEGNRDQYPNHDEVKYFIHKHSLIPLEQRLAKNRSLDFQRRQTLNDLYQAVAELQLFTAEDIIDWAAFRKRFESPRSAPVERIHARLSSPTQSLLTAGEPSLDDEAKNQTINDLNGVLKTTVLYDATVFSNLALAGEARNLVLQVTEQPVTAWPYHQLLRFNRLLLEAAFPEEIMKGAVYALKPVPAPRYWRPKEPVVLLVDEVHKTVGTSPRHGRDVGLRKGDGLLKCHVLELEDTAIERRFEDIRKEVIALKQAPAETETRVGFSTWTKQPWHPFMLEWEVEVLPLKGKYKVLRPDHPHPLNRAYGPHCILENYQLDDDGVDLVIQPGQETLATENSRYYGHSILTSHAKLQLISQIRHFLEKRLLEDYYTSKNVAREKRTDDDFAREIDAIVAWYSSLPEDKKDPVLDRILSVYKYVNGGGDSGFHFLAQSLSGFNEALLMCKQTLQLPIGDPLGFDDYQPFTEAVRDAVGTASRTAPQPRNDFNPIRTGILKIKRLRLVDTFGQVQTLTLQDNEVITTNAMTTPANPHLAILPPRIVQPARLNFRWLAADGDLTLEEDDDPEMNSHPASTPVCGWLLPNNLDNKLMVYDARGRALGSLNPGGRWEPAPGGNLAAVVWPLPNPHLHKVVTHLKEQETTHPGFLDGFLTVVEDALENIDPEGAANHDALALLMGRPVAVARAMLNLEVQGRPAVDQDWNVFRQDMERAFLKEAETGNALRQDPDRETQDHAEVEFPIWIGKSRQLNDGLVGYWIEEGDRYRANTFYVPRATAGPAPAHPGIAAHRENERSNLTQSVSGPPPKLTLLLDPRGAIHATCGVLPTKAIHIPPDQFAEALGNIEVTFLSAPILTDRGKISLPLPDEPGYVWSWCEKENGAWETITQIEQVTTAPTAAAAPQELREGWLKLTAKDRK